MYLVFPNRQETEEKMKRIVSIILILGLSAMLFAAGAQEEAVGAPVEENLSAASGTITLYTSVPQAIVDNIKADFEANNPTITLEIYRSGTSNVLAKLMAEKEAGNITADLIWLADFSVFENLKDLDMLLPYMSPQASILPKQFYDPEGYYYGSRMMFMVLAYNTDVIDSSNPPDSWFDMLNPEYEGKIGSSAPDRSGAFMIATGAMLKNKNFGWDYFEKLGENGNVIDSNSGIAKKIANRELVLGFTLDYIARGLKDGGSPIDIIYPKEGSVLTPSPIGIMKTTANPSAAKVFLNYTLSAAGQQTLADNGFIPLHPDAKITMEAITPDDIILMDTVDYTWIRENSLDIVETFNGIFD